MKKLIFTDLDGTFLNHDDYSFTPSKQALQKIKEQHIPLIFTTSKTKAEVIRLQQKVGIIEPFITENGAALFIPKGYQGLPLDDLEEYEGYKVVVFGKHYDEVLKFYSRYKTEFGLRGFSDMDLDEVTALTGLDKTAAALAKERDFTEPFTLQERGHLTQLNELAKSEGLKITEGGRFFHLIAETQDKGVAVKETSRLFSQLFSQKLETFGFGDGPNDIAMFENVDHPVVIQNAKGGYVACDIAHIRHSTYQGSAGFNEMVLKHVIWRNT